MASKTTVGVAFTGDALLVEAYPFRSAYEYASPNISRWYPVNYNLGVKSLTAIQAPQNIGRLFGP